MLKITALVLFSFFVMVHESHAQSKSIKKIWGFEKEILHGKEMRDLEGNTISRQDTAYFFYVEVQGKVQLQITSVFYKKRSFLPAVYPVTEMQVTAGINRITGKKVILKKGTANSLWRVELNPAEAPAKNIPLSEKMIIKGRINKQPFTFNIDKLVLLEGDIVG